jgi:hypothetical protein
MLFSSCRCIAGVILLLLSQAVSSGAVKRSDREAIVLRSLSTQTVAGTISIDYSLVPLGGNVYRYVYTITNNGSLGNATRVQLFDILFDPSLYQEPSLQIVTPASLQTQWSELLLKSVPGVSAAYDALALQGGIPVGSTVSGFSVQFVWLGSGVPGTQPFQIFDPNTFQLLQTGQTTTPSSPVAAPAASTFSLILLAVGLALTGGCQVYIYNRRVRVATRNGYPSSD